MSKKKITRLELFLRDERVLTKFRANLSKGDTINALVERQVEYSRHYRHAIKAAFIWSTTHEGFDFWYELNEKWEEACKMK